MGPIPSATAILIRDSGNGNFCTIEILLVKRHEDLRTNAGAWVFPGGRIDELDYDTENHTGHSESSEYRAAKNAAKREILEETSIDLPRSSLHPYAHWTAPVELKRRFATWFFLAEFNDSHTISVDGSEIVDFQWINPADALAQHKNGEILLTPPTFVSLTDLLPFNSVVEAIAQLSNFPPKEYIPKLLIHEDSRIALYSEDSAYETSDLLIKGRKHRLLMRGNIWHYQCDV